MVRRECLNREYFTKSQTKSLSPWKGLASYYTIVMDGQISPDAAWYYPHPSPLARKLKGHVAFWVRIERHPESDEAPGRGLRRMFARRGQ